MAEINSIGEEIRAFVQAKLRSEEPFMKLDRVSECAKLCAQTYENYLQTHNEELKATKSRISFLSLSKEIRNTIYELVLVIKSEGEGGMLGTKSVYIGPVVYDRLDDRFKHAHGIDLTPLKTKLLWPTEWTSQPALTRVCRQIRAETLPIYYGTNEFVTQTWDGYDYDLYGLQVEECKLPSDLGPKDLAYVSTRGLHDWLVGIGQANIDRLRRIRIISIVDFICNFEFEKWTDGHRETVDVLAMNWTRSVLSHHGLAMPAINVSVQEWDRIWGQGWVDKRAN